MTTGYQEFIPGYVRLQEGRLQGSLFVWGGSLLGRIRMSITVKTVAAEIQSPKFTEIKSICVAFQLSADLQRPTPTEISNFFQSKND